MVQRLLLAGGDAKQLHEGAAMDALGLAEAAAHAEILELLRRPADERHQPLQLSQEVGLHGLCWMASTARSKTPHLGSDRLRRLRLVTASLAAVGGSALPGGEAGPLGAQPLPRLLEPAASQVADSTA